MCTYKGSQSAAAPGRCTKTAGYIANAEIDEIIESSSNVQKIFDTDSHSNILVYSDTEWVAYMDSNTKAAREWIYSLFNLGGISDWAVDLQEMYHATISNPTVVPCGATFGSLDAIEAAKSSIPGHCMNHYIFEMENKLLSNALANYQKLLGNGYDAKFAVYERYVRSLVWPSLTSYMTKHASRYFDYTHTRRIYCCKDCSSAQACSGGCTGGGNCVSGDIVESISFQTERWAHRPTESTITARTNKGSSRTSCKCSASKCPG